MIYQLVIPRMEGESEEFRVLTWQGADGHIFQADELIVEVELQKAILEIRASKPSVLRRILSQAGEWHTLGKPLAVLSDAADESLPEQSLDKLPMLEVSFDVL